ncbi:hypothetical protein EDD22DRAFT_952349 [Suillus occidentalis]|nr:hypothetical protein EDD22DRAFT_952349 [Suillus occidentalis]
MILPLLLSPNKIAITVTPLKLLQCDHVQEFKQYGVPLIAINHDTPHNKTLWNCVSAGAFHNLLVAPEQFFPKADWFFFVDEAHFIIMAGEPKAGEKLAFRAAYGNLADVLVQLPLGVPVALFSATLPQLMLHHAVIPMVDSIKNLSNLDFLVSVPFHPPMSYPPKSIIFIDHKLSTAAVARYLNTRLPEAVRCVFKFRHLHFSMSTEHNKMVFDEFRKSNGLVQGVVATSGATGG